MFDLSPPSAPLTALQIAARRHRAEDRLVTGDYGRLDPDGATFRGCSVGCLAYDAKPDAFTPGRSVTLDVDVDVHALAASAYGYPVWLAWVQDYLFERLPDGEHLDWHVDLADAIAARTRDWADVKAEIVTGVLDMALEGKSDGTGAAMVRKVLDLVRRDGPDGGPTWLPVLVECVALHRAAPPYGDDEALLRTAYQVLDRDPDRSVCGVASAAGHAQGRRISRQVRDLVLVALDRSAAAEPAAEPRALVAA